MAPSDKEFIEDLDSNQAKTQKRARFIIYLILAVIYLVILGVYSIEGIHSRGGQYIWVIVIFASQIIGFFFTLIVWNLSITYFVLKNKDDKIFLSKRFYNHLIILEDYKYV